MTRVDLIHATGNENVRQALTALADEDLLGRFFTTVGWPAEPSRLARRLVPGSLLTTRTYDAVPQDRFRLLPAREIVRNVALRFPAAPVRGAATYLGPIGADWVYRGFDRGVARRLAQGPRPDVVYTYSNLAEDSFRVAERLGITRVLEVAHVRFAKATEIINAAREEVGLPPHVPGARERAFLDKGDRELGLADLIVSPSRQVTDSVLEFQPNARVVQLPYGCPDVDPGITPITRRAGERLRVLYVGRLDPSKGVHALARIAELCRDEIELTIVGTPPAADNTDAARLLEHATHLGPKPRSEVFALMRAHHVQLNTSLVEGRSLAALEALSHGLPLLATAGSGVDDLVVQGCGALLETNAPESTAALLLELAADPDRIEAMSLRAIEVARENSWARFRTDLAALLHSIAPR